MGIVNDSLTDELLYDPRYLPCRESRHGLGYPSELNVTTELLDRWQTTDHANSVAIKCQDQLLTYHTLGKRVNRLANALVHHGIRPGCRILIHLPNFPEFIESWLATLRIGAIAVATMPTLKHRELLQIVTETEPACLITTPELSRFFDFDDCDCIPKLRILVGDDAQPELAYENYVAKGKDVHAPAPTSVDDIALIAYTSGSTGRQKGAVHTHGDILAIADTYAKGILDPIPSDCFAGHSPMAFTYGLGGLLIFPFRFGASVVIDPRPFEPDRWLDTIQREKVTLLFATTTAARLYLREPACGRKALSSSLRAVVSAGEPLTKTTFDRWRETTGTEILDGCGSTEMLHIWISQIRGQAEGGCTGSPVSLYQVRLVDENGLEIREMEAEGVASLQGPTGCLYWRQPELQEKTVQDGWTLSGDLFRRDGKGRYWYIARMDDLIVSGGYKISPTEVEESLLGFSAIREAVVVGIPDELRGHIVRACLVLKPGFEPGEMLARKVSEHTKTEIARFKCPKEIVFLQEIPRTPTGKVDRNLMRSLTANQGVLPSTSHRFFW